MTPGVVFAGPSLSGAARLAPADVTLAPPAAAGDVYRAARDGARVIGLADAVFEDRPTVGHKEILWALSEGVAVIGAASLGALRAVECAPWGMQGLGAVHALCRDCALEDDHRIAVLHAPAALGFAPLTEALVNVSATLAAAVADGVITEGDARALDDAAEARGFRAATWRAILDRGAPPEAVRAAFEAWLPHGRVDLKRADAEALVARVAADVHAPRRREARASFPETLHWRALRAAFDAKPPALDRAEFAALDELRLDPPRYEAEALRAFARRAAGREPARDAGPALVEAFRAERGLGTAAAFGDWLTANRTDPDRLGAALVGEERLLAALDAAGPALGSSILDALRAEDGFATLARRAEAKAAALAATPEPDFDDAAIRVLLARFAASRRIALPSDDPDAVARTLGLPDRRALHRMLAREAAFAGEGSARWP